MSLLNAMYSGVSGLQAEGEALGVVGDNVANANTIGFKQSRAIFEDVLGGNAGAGVKMQRSQQIFAQGSMLNTGQSSDLALSGDGYFVVSGSIDGAQGNFYTRAGQTSLRKDGMVVNPEGLQFQGYAAKPDGSISSTLGPIQVRTAALPPKATSGITVTANLDSNAKVPAQAFDVTNPGATSNFSTTTKVYDSLGTAHDVDIYYEKTAGGQWNYHAVAQGGDVVGGTAGQNVEIATGQLSFDANGALQTNALSGGGTVDFNNAAPGQALKLNFGTPIDAGGTGLDGITQFGAPSNVSSQNQDGYGSGDLSGVKIDGSGVVSGVYTNGQTIPVAQLAVAKFRSNDGLARVGHNSWAATNDSGEAALGAAGSGGRAAISSGSLEQSNVDVSTQFVELIAHQRAFQANSKTITTADQMLQELMQIKQ